MAVTTDGLKNYLRLPPDSTEDLSGFLASAKSKAWGAGIPDFQHNAQYDMFILQLAGFYYDNRGLTFGGLYPGAVEENVRKMINSAVLELRYAEEDTVE